MHYRWFIFVFLVLSLGRGLNAQVAAGFNIVAPNSNCNPAVYSFVNTSTGAGLTYRWNFGVYPGINSVFTNPSTTYIDCGSYQVKLVATDSTGVSDSIVQTVSIRCSPKARFTTSNTLGCVSMQTSFTNTSIPGSGAITSFGWDFGDGNGDTTSNPSHTYLTPGCKNVTLVVTNAFGCSADTTIHDAVCILVPPVSNFTSDVHTNCHTPFNVNYQATPSGGFAPYTYQWFFDGGTPSTSHDANPSVVYNSPGTYTTKLITTDAHGCSDTSVQAGYIFVPSDVANFSIENNPHCAPAKITFIADSNSYTSSWNWSVTHPGTMGPNDTYSNVMTFPQSGNYNICLTIDYTNGCTAQRCTTLYVSSPPFANFGVSGNLNTCLMPNPITFTDSSLGSNLSYSWSFPGGTPSTCNTATPPVISYQQCGSYSAGLMVTNNSGCVSNAYLSNFLNIPCNAASFTVDPSKGCLPLTSNFNSTASTGNPVSWQWDFGDPGSGTDTSFEQNPTHIYNDPGCHTVTLTTTTAQGCVYVDSIADAVCGGFRPHANFSGNPPMDCVGQPVTFADSSTNEYSYTNYYWNFHNPVPFTTESTDSNPTYTYSQAGVWDITLIVSNYDCADTITKDSYVTTVFPVSVPAVHNTCGNPYTVTLDGTASQGAQSYQWVVIGGTPDTMNTAVAQATFPGPGSYSASLYVQNDSTGCGDLQSVIVNITGPEAEFTASPRIGCSPFQTCFGITSNQVTNYLWHINNDQQTFDTLFTSPSPCVTFHKPGRYNVQLITGDSSGCVDTVYKPEYIVVSQPIASFNAAPVNGCAPLTVNFQDNSTFQTTGIAAWHYDFGDPPSGNNNINAHPEGAHTYNTAGEYTVTYVITDSNGCQSTDRIFNMVQVNKPQVSFTDTLVSGCQGVNACFTSTTPNPGIHYQWLFGDSGTSTLASPCHLYTRSGSFNIAVIATDGTGCTDTVSRQQPIDVVIPHPAFIADTTTATCPPLQVSFSNLTTGYDPSVTWYWRFGDGQVSTLKNPFHIYSTPGSYSVTLIATVPNGCVDSVVKTDYINISGPIATLAAPPTGGCVPHQDCIHAFSTNTVTYTWDFGDGTVLPGVDSICYTYTRSGNFFAQLVLDNGLGCIYAMPLGDIAISGMVSAFAINTPAICGPGIIQFQDTSYGASTVQSISWSFGDPGSGSNNVSTSANPSHYYAHPGQYRVVETIFTADGCANSSTQTVLVRPLPVPQMHVQNPAPCSYDTVHVSENTLDTAGIASVIWNFGDSLSGGVDVSHTPVSSHYYTAPGTYTITLSVSDRFGCTADTSSTITEHQIPEAIFSANNACVNAQPISFVNASQFSTGYSWSFGDGAISAAINPTHNYQDTGTYTVQLVARNNFCVDSLKKQVRVYPLPVPAFNLSSVSGCGVPFVISASNSSTNAIAYSWNFGNNTFSTLKNPAITFTDTGQFNIMLTAVSAQGCQDTTSRSVIIHPGVVAAFTAGSACLNDQPIKFTNQTPGAATYYWSFGDGGYSSLSSPTHVYTDTGSFVTQLIARTNYCSDTASRYVDIFSLPVAAFALPDTGKCGPNAQFTVVNQSANASSYYWNFGNNTSSTQASPAAFYSSSGTYQVQLIASSNHGCMDTMTKALTVYPLPEAAMDISSTSGCAPLTVNVQANTSNVDSFIWNFGAGGAPVSGQLPGASYTYTDTGNYSISVMMTSNHGCKDTLELTDTIKVHPVPKAAFDTVINSSGYPYNGIVSFINLSKNANSYTWNFGDGNTSNDVNPTHTYEHIDTFSAELIAATDYGCADTAFETLYVIQKALYVPNALQPGYEGSQDLVKVWKPLGIGLLSYHAQVFDKWGALIWESEALNDWQPVEGWDGTYLGKPCEQDVYVWKINAVFLDGSVWPGMTYDKNEGGGTKTIGSITLIR